MMCPTSAAVGTNRSVHDQRTMHVGTNLYHDPSYIALWYHRRMGDHRIRLTEADIELVVGALAARRAGVGRDRQRHIEALIARLSDGGSGNPRWRLSAPCPVDPTRVHWPPIHWSCPSCQGHIEQSATPASPAARPNTPRWPPAGERAEQREAYYARAAEQRERLENTDPD